MSKKEILINSDIDTLDLIDSVSDQFGILERGYNGKIKAICECLITKEEQRKKCREIINDLLEFISQEVPSNIISSSESLKKIQINYRKVQEDQ